MYTSAPPNHPTCDFGMSLAKLMKGPKVNHIFRLWENWVSMRASYVSPCDFYIQNYHLQIITYLIIDSLIKKLCINWQSLNISTKIKISSPLLFRTYSSHQFSLKVLAIATLFWLHTECQSTQITFITISDERLLYQLSKYLYNTGNNRTIKVHGKIKND